MSGNSNQRKQVRKKLVATLQQMGVSMPEGWRPERVERPKEGVSKREKMGDGMALGSFAAGLFSWGWSVVAPESSVIFGSILLFIGVVFASLAAIRMFSLRKIYAAIMAAVMLTGFYFFDRYVVVNPQRGKPFKEMLTEGYHISSECGSLAGASPMPEWMRDQSKEWQAKTEQMIAQRLDYKNSQLWNAAIIIGKVSDENTVAYQCTWLANKVGALEAIVATNYDKDLKHRDYTGPTYWYQAVDGKVDITDALKNGNTKSMVFTGAGKDGMVEITGHVPMPGKK